jgi:hypothetical protein
MELPQWRCQNRSHTQPPAACQIDLRIIFCIVAKHNFAAAQTLGRNTRVGLQPDADIGSSAASTRPADDFASAAQRDGRAGRSG